MEQAGPDLLFINCSKFVKRN